mgnify:CR=1 FL=1|jgi:hypothetical protein
MTPTRATSTLPTPEEAASDPFTPINDAYQETREAYGAWTQTELALERDCPTDKRGYYDQTHPTYKANAQAAKRLNDAKQRHHQACVNTVNHAIQQGDAQTIWRAIMHATYYSFMLTDGDTNTSALIDHANWEDMALMGDSLYDCDAFRSAASALAGGAFYDPSTTLHGLIKQLSEESEKLTENAIARRETMKTIMRGIIENAARVILKNMSKASKPHSLIPTEHSLFTNTCACEYFMFADNSAAALGRLIIWKDTSGLMLRSITAGAYQLDTRSTDALTVASERWRNIIDNTSVDAPEHREARYAHTAIAATLFALRGTIAASDLSALIDMFNEQEQAREAGKDAHTLTLTFCDPRYPHESVNSVESLIDYVAQRMSGADRPQ